MQKPTLQKSISGKKQIPSTKTLAILGVIVLAGLFLYGFVRINALSNQMQEISAELALSNSLLEEKTDVLEKNLTNVNNLAVGLSKSLLKSDQTVQGLQQAVGETSSTIEALDKLSKTDPELLQKYSKVYFLNEHYVPPRLVEIETQYLYIETEPEQIHALVWPHLQNLLQTAQKDNVELFVRSAFRSFDEQRYLKGGYTITYGAGTANQFSADQGYSEHQLGTTVDFITTGLNGQLDGFENTKAYEWMRNNAYKYGFTLSYPPNNAFYIFEPWHWRYVGIELATLLHNQNKYFYDLDQREIDEYLINIFEQ